MEAESVVPLEESHPCPKEVWPVPPEPTASAVPRVRTPVDEKLEVALPPKYAVPTFEKRVEEALAKDWRAVQELALAMLSESEDAVPPIWLPSVPELERDAPMAREEVAVEYTTPELPARRPEREVARVVWPVTASVFPRVRVPRDAVWEKRFVDDAVVAKKAVEVAPPCPIENTVVDAFVTASNKLPVPHVVSLLYGVEVPMPTREPVVRKIDDVAVSVVPT